MAFQGFHHIGLYVKDAQRALTFYTEGLGGKVTFSFPMGDTGDTIYLVDMGGGAVIEIVPSGTGAPEKDARFAHIALLTNDVPAAYQMALAAGASEKSAPQDVSLGAMPIANAFVYGPEGESIEFFHVKG